VRAGSSPAGGTNILGDMMSDKSSIDYAELAGLRIALSNLAIHLRPDTEVVINWLRSRIKELEKK
jgi:hypothetical protein